MQKDLGMKWLKVCKILWLISTALSLYSIWITLIGSAIVFSAFPIYTVISAVLSVGLVILTILAYTAVSSFCASRFKYIIALFIVMPISAAVSAYGNVIAEDLGTKLIVSGGCFLIIALAWSLPNIIYFMHRKRLFTGADPDNDTTEPVTSTDAGSGNNAAGETPQHGIEARKVKVTPVKIGSDKQGSKAKQSKEEPQANEKQSTAGYKKNKKPILTYSLAALCLALGVLCVWQAAQLSEARSDISGLQSTITAGETKMKAQSYEIKVQNETIDDLNDQIDKLYGEVNRLLGYRKYITIEDIREITGKYR